METDTNTKQRYCSSRNTHGSLIGQGIHHSPLEQVLKTTILGQATHHKLQYKNNRSIKKVLLQFTPHS